MSKDEVIALGILFQVDDATTYVESMMQGMRTSDSGEADHAGVGVAGD